MSKQQTKQNNKVFTKIWELTLVLAQLATAYVFATQDNQVLWVLAFILGLNAAIKLTDKFVIQ